MFEFEVGRGDTYGGALQVGTGLDVKTMERRGVAVVVAKSVVKSGEDPVSGRDSLTYALESVDRSTLEKERLNFRGSAKVSLGFLSGKVSGGVRFGESKARSKSYLRASVEVTKRVESVEFDKLRLVEEGDVGSQDFEDKFGQAMVCSVSYGARLEALITISSAKDEKYEEFDVSGKIKFGPVGNASGAFAQTVRDATSNREVDISISQMGGDLDSVKLTPTISDLLDAVVKFPERVGATSGHLVPLSFCAISYAEIAPFVREKLEPSPEALVQPESIHLDLIASRLLDFEIAQKEIAEELSLETLRADGDPREKLEAYRRLLEAKALATEKFVRGYINPKVATERLANQVPTAFHVSRGLPWM